MRVIKGVVCVAVIDRAEVLFGKNMGRGQRHYEAFCTNNMTPFLNASESQAAKAELQNRSDVDAVSLAKIQIGLAETTEEIYSLRAKKSLIVARKMPEFGEMILVGAFTEGSPSRYPLYGTLLADNGLQPFTSFESAQYTASEEHRQSGCPVFIATFRIKRL
jgi:hypothetical protein